MYTDPFGKVHRYDAPLGWVQSEHENVSHPQDWDAILARGLRFEHYRGHTTRSFIRGHCLEPLITNRHSIRVRPVADDEALVDLGLYVLDPAEHANSALAIAYREREGIAPGESIRIVKVLKFACYEWWCFCKDSMAPLDGHIVVGQVVGVC